MHPPDKSNTLQRRKMRQPLKAYLINYMIIRMGSQKNGEVGFNYPLNAMKPQRT